MPTFGLYVRDDWDFMSDFTSLIKRDYDDKETQYLKEVVERDLTIRRGAKADISPNCMVELARDILGKAGAREMQRAVEGIDQADALIALLKGYIAERSEKPKHSSRIPEKTSRA